MSEKQFAEIILPTLRSLLVGMHHDLKVMSESGEQSKDFLDGFGRCSWKLMSYIELLEKAAK